LGIARVLGCAQLQIFIADALSFTMAGINTLKREGLRL
jgi:hypothetical protein